MVEIVELRYAGNVNAQKNPNLTKREDWSNVSNAVGHTKDVYATSQYTKKTVTKKNKKGKKVTDVVYNYPYKLTAHDFGFNIPSNAYIKQIKFGVRLKSNSTAREKIFPACGFYIKDKKASVTDAKKYDSGWHNGIYWVYSGSHITKSRYTEQYVMDDSDFYKGGYSVSDLNSSYFGVDLNFAEDKFDFEETISLQWVWCEITYKMPSYVLDNNKGVTSESSPVKVDPASSQSVTFRLYQRNNKSNDGYRTFYVKLPFGLEYDGMPVSTSGGTVSRTSDLKIVAWTVNCLSGSETKLTVNYKSYSLKSLPIQVYGDVYNTKTKLYDKRISSSCYVKSKGDDVDYSDLHILYGKFDELGSLEYHQGHTNCLTVQSKSASTDSTITSTIKQNYDWLFVTKEYPDENGDTVYENIYLGGNTDSSVTMASHNLDSFTVYLNHEYKEGHYLKLYYIPANSTVDIVFNVPSDNVEFSLDYAFCMKPLEIEESYEVVVTMGLSSDSFYYSSNEPLSYHIGTTDNDSNTEFHELILNERVNFTNHRIASTLTTGAYVLTCTAKDGDSLMYELAPNIHMYLWEQIDYIGCVPVEHHHFDPKSTYKDKLLDSHYKNKRYMGKELASDEDIDLNIRLHPEQVTTIQGLIDMDKPIPINANHLCFEGDALNHRGWAEIYGITTQETNPHWYKCSIDVKYLTHNLNTRFHIRKGSKTFSNYGMPQLFAESTSSGDEIDDNYFIIDTDGTYAFIEDETSYEDFYDEDGNTVIWNEDETTLTVDEITYTGDEVLDYIIGLNYEYKTPLEVGEAIQVLEYFNIDSNQKNQFGLRGGQHLLIRSKDKLQSINQITLDWTSNMLPEIKENAVTRIVRLVDEYNNSVFEYEYTDFDFNNNGTITDLTTGDDEVFCTCRVIGRQRDRADFKEVINKEIDLALDVEDDEITYYGSTVHFMRNGDSLRVKDEGFSGSEIDVNLTGLEGKEYHYEVYWENKNTDAESNDIDAYIDLIAQDSVLESNLEDEYGNLYISPFPVKNKRILYTRNAEEGVIYYLKGGTDEEEFTYLIEPYYQYHNGVDLRNDSGSSIFNLNYGYKVVYLENGLVSLGINRLTGRMYLRKWDNIVKDYITLFNLQLSKYDDVNINSISDDRIELQASDTTIIMYRGHPYVIFKHELESISLNDSFTSVWGQQVDDDYQAYPVFFDLMNKDNLLPSCVSSKLDDDCVELSESTVSGLTSVDISVSQVTSDIYVNESASFTVSGLPTEDAVAYYLVDFDGDDKTGFEVMNTPISDGAFTHTFDTDGVYRIIAVYCGDDTYEYSVSPQLTVTVKQRPVSPTPSPTPTPQELGTWNLTVDCSSTMKYRDGSKIVYTLTRGGEPVSGEDIQVVDFNHINTVTTNTNGQAIVYNKRADTHPDEYRIGARYYEGGHLIIKVGTDVKVKKGEAEIIVTHGADSVGESVNFKLRDANSQVALANKKLSVSINGKKYTRYTNNNGNEAHKIGKKGTYKYICVFKGDEDYKKCTKKYREYVNG